MPYTILRTAAGSPVAPSMIRALQSLDGVRIVVVDVDPLSCGFGVADQSYTVPRADAPDYLEHLLAICANEDVDLLFPDLDEELPLLARQRAKFEERGTQVLVSSAETIDTCRDKLATYTFFRENNIPTPWTTVPADLPEKGELSYPLLIKPRSGRGSQGVFKITTPAELDFFSSYVEGPIVQEYLPGVEYTIDTLSDLQGRFCYCSVRQRVATDSGISMKGKTILDTSISEMSGQIVEALGLIGPACVQCIEDETGAVKFTEVNPRIAGSAVLSMAAGAPIVEDAIRLARGETPRGLTNYRAGYVMLRHWSEVFVDDAS